MRQRLYRCVRVGTAQGVGGSPGRDVRCGWIDFQCRKRHGSLREHPDCCINGDRRGSTKRKHSRARTIVDVDGYCYHRHYLLCPYNHG